MQLSSSTCIAATFALMTAAAGATGCAPHHKGMSGVTTLTSAEAELKYDYDAEARYNLVRGRNAAAVSDANAAAAHAPRSGWPLYERGAALAAMGRTDEAVESYRGAEGRFRDWSNKSLAIYGRARALDDAGRCSDARAAYQEYAQLVREHDATRADAAVEVAAQCAPRASQSSLNAEVAQAASAQQWDRVIALSGGATAAEAKDPWLHYQRGIAFAGLRKTDEAVAAFDVAAASFPKDDVRGQSTAIYGKARALVDGGRCASAARAYEEYARLVNDTDPEAAKMARQYAEACPTK
jgi:tetratricopeptide (TPR) repeat protein